MASGRKLKVFLAQIGFYDTIVAAASQAAALRAWGVRQNLFANGEARVIDDAPARTAALRQPDVPLRRLIGTTNPFELEPRGLPAIPAAKTRPTKRAAAARKPAKPAAPPADRTNLASAEAALRAVDGHRRDEEAGLRARQAALDAERAEKQAAYVENRKAATAAVVAARQAFRKAGGTD